MLLTAVGLGLFALLAVAALPLPRVRQATLTFAARAGQSAVLAVVAACGTLFVLPDSTPTPLAPYADRVVSDVRQFLPGLVDALPGAAWLIVAAAVVVVSLPVLSLVEFAARVMGQTAVVQALRKELRLAADALDRRLAGITPPPPPDLISELVNAADAMRAVSGEPRQGRPATEQKLVRDLL